MKSRSQWPSNGTRHIIISSCTCMQVLMILH